MTACTLICEGLAETKGDGGGENLLGAMKGLSWSRALGVQCRSIAQTRESVQNIYIRKVEKMAISSGIWSSKRHE